MNFGMLPPEINSARMYSGSGAGPLMAAAAAWDGLTAQLENFAAGYSSELAELRGHGWSGASADAMAAAAGPFVTWASDTATLTSQAAGQARAAAAAYQAAFAATVPPAAVTANRTLLATLVATNFLGQNTGAIAATEAGYAEMWARDATAMYGYAASSAAATELTPFQQPPPTTSGTGALPDAATTVQGALGVVDDVNTLTKFSGLVADNVRTGTQMASWVMAVEQLLGDAVKAAPKAAAAARLSVPPAAPVAVLASVGTSAAVGKLSVPGGWPTAPAGTAQVGQPPSPTHRFLPAYATPGHVSPMSVAPAARSTRRRRGTPVYRMRDRSFQMPRPAVGG